MAEQYAFLLFAVALLVGLSVFVRLRFRVEPPTPLFLGVPPAEALDRATGFMASRGFAVSHAGRTSATFARPKRANVAVGLLLLLLGVIPGLLYFGLFGGTYATTAAVEADPEGPVLVLSGDDPAARADLERWARENLAAPDPPAEATMAL